MLFAWSIERYSNEYDSLYAGYEFEWFFIYQVGMIHEARNGQEGKGALWTIYQAVLSGETHVRALTICESQRSRTKNSHKEQKSVSSLLEWCNAIT